jgi:DNA-binding transcriptional MerR regulator
MTDKAEGAFRTIGEVSAELGVPQHILRYWETRFPLLRPLQRAGNRRYYRPADVALVRRIDRLLNREGYTVRGVQQLLERAEDAPAAAAPPSDAVRDRAVTLKTIRDSLVRALDDDLPVGS